MSNNGKSYDGLIFSIFFVAYGWFINSILRRIAPKLFKGAEDVISTDIYSSYLRNYEGKEIESISSRFNKMCVTDPIAYKNHKDIDKVIKDYSDLIKGRILDPDGSNAPSPLIDGKDNPDYYRYLRNQKRALDKTGADTEWITKEMHRVTSKSKAESIEKDFAEHLIKSGLPEDYVGIAMAYERLESYTPESWSSFIEAVVGAVKSDCCPKFIKEYIKLVFDPEYYTPELIDDYCTLRTSGSPEIIALEYVKGTITLGQALRATYFVERGLEEEEALVRVLNSILENVEAGDLKRMYRSRI